MSTTGPWEIRLEHRLMCNSCCPASLSSREADTRLLGTWSAKALRFLHDRWADVGRNRTEQTGSAEGNSRVP